MIINGSPRLKGNTETLADFMIKGIEDAGNSAVKFNLREMNISPCVGCFQCRGKGNRCVQQDEMLKIYDAYFEANVVVLGSPLQ